MKNEYVAEKVIAKSESESKRLTEIEQVRLTNERARNLTAEIEKLNSKRKLLGDRRVFKNDEEFKEAGLKILKRYDATHAEIKWFLSVVEKSPFAK